MAPLKVLIAGAGIAGPALAFWLARMPGCEITIIERSSLLRDTGHQIDFRGQGIVIMRLMGIEKAVRAALCSEPGLRFIDHRGRSQAFVEANKTGKGTQSATSEFEIMRGDLVNILYEATRDLKGVKYVFNSHIKDFTQDEGSPNGKVHVTFADGRKEDYDMLVGAEGIRSKVRKLMHGPSFPDPRHDIGAHVAYFTAPSQEGDTNDWTMCIMPGRKFVSTRKDKPDNIRVYLGLRGNCETLDAAKTLPEQKAALVELFKGSEGAQVDRFLKALAESPMADDLYSQHMTQIRLPEGAWSRGRVALLGDAAYCPTPFGGGVGTTAALIGAYLLAGELAKQWKEGRESLNTFGIEKASKEYERHLRPFITSEQKGHTWFLNAIFPETKLGVWIFHTIVWIVVSLRIDRLLKNAFSPEESRKLEYPDYFGLQGKSSA
ncbi:putative monooxygenase [Hypoxylon rubiginosum]|uniref:Monooxygenase n=1 Tax=Hypoxylon rubiginosum TaxID=110542 RepID=A0ACC0D4E7_9PEZI|nr:putative monooxygenase [Hypoxylon rubiginosum]